MHSRDSAFSFTAWRALIYVQAALMRGRDICGLQADKQFTLMWWLICITGALLPYTTLITEKDCCCMARKHS